MSSTSLVTNGFICYQGQPILVPVPEPASLDTPAIVGTVEVRPKIRRVTSPDTSAQPKPAVTSAQELRPRVVGKVPADIPETKPPTTRTAQELKPRIVKAEEED